MDSQTSAPTLPSQPTLTFEQNCDELYDRDHDVNRHCNACVRAICIGPIILVLCTFLLAWNERQACCESRAIDQGQDLVHEVSCDDPDPYEGKLVLYTCPLLKEGLNAFRLLNTDWEDALGYLGTGLSIRAEMMQCVETYQGRGLGDRLSGSAGAADYVYTKEWRDRYLDDSLYVEKELSMYAQGCDGGVTNPSWPEGVPQNGALYAPSVHIGAFRAEGDWVERVPLETPLDFSAVQNLPAGWLTNGSWYITDKFTPNNDTDIGRVRVTFNGTNWHNAVVTVLGMTVGGKMQRWVARNTWLCTGFFLGELRMGNHSKQEVFDNMHLDSFVMTIILRFVGFALAWLAFTQLLGPLELMRECVPSMGSCVFESLAFITMYLACVPATICMIAVIGIVWIAMRPFLSIFLIMLMCFCMAGACFFKTYRDQLKALSEEEEEDAVECVGKLPNEDKGCEPTNLDKE